MNRRKFGFTLIEMLIVIVVIAILALIVIPRMLAAGWKAKEYELKRDLLELRDDIKQFKSDCGRYPNGLGELMTKPADIPGLPKLDSPTPGAKQWRGPYLKTLDGRIPIDPFTNSSTTWQYTPSTGEVKSGSREQSPFPQKNGQDPHYNTW